MCLGKSEWERPLSARDLPILRIAGPLLSGPITSHLCLLIPQPGPYRHFRVSKQGQLDFHLAGRDQNKATTSYPGDLYLSNSTRVPDDGFDVDAGITFQRDILGPPRLVAVPITGQETEEGRCGACGAQV